MDGWHITCMHYALLEEYLASFKPWYIEEGFWRITIGWMGYGYLDYLNQIYLVFVEGQPIHSSLAPYNTQKALLLRHSNYHYFSHAKKILFSGCKGNPKAPVRPDRVSASSVQHRSSAGAHHFYLCNHWDDHIWSCQTHRGHWWPGQLWNFRQIYAALVQVNISIRVLLPILMTRGHYWFTNWILFCYKIYFQLR